MGGAPGGAPMDPSMMGGAPGGAPGGMPMDPSMMGGAPGGAPGGMPMDPSMMGGAPGGAPMDPSMMGGAPGGAAPGGGGGGVLEQLAQQSDDQSGGGSETGQPQNDDAMKMVLDNMSTMMDMLSKLTEKVEALEGGSSAPAESQVTTQMPNLKSLNRDYKNYVKKAVSAAVYELSKSINSMAQKSAIKSVSISDESADMLADTIKGVLLSIEDSIVNNVTERLLSETTVIKSASSRNDSRNDFKIVHPGTYVDGMSEGNVDSRVFKSTRGNGGEEEISVEKMDTLKSLVEEYNSIRGYTADKSQQRARIIDEARDYLGVHPTLFATYANKTQKSRT